MAYHDWEIKNFSCWNGDIHGESLKLYSEVYYVEIPDVTLYPRGFDGNGEYLVVKMKMHHNNDVTELSIIGSDGSVICTRRREADSERLSTIFFTGPSFEEVVAGVRGNEPLHKDRLILRWKTLSVITSTKFRTAIEAYSSLFQIKSEHWEEPIGNPKRPKWKVIGQIYFRFGYTQKSIYVRACKDGSTLEDTKIIFKLSSNAKEKILARTSIWMLNGNNIMQEHEDSCILVDGDNHLLPYEVSLKDIQGGLQIIMRCKIVTGRFNEDFSSVTDLPLSPDIKITGFSRLSEIESFASAENAVTALTKDLTCLYQDHNYSDFELRCGTVSFPTHRSILSSRSPVFKAMLSVDMTEAASGHMDIEDLDPHTLGRFLAFLYSGTRDKDLEWEGALKLYYVADKYQVPSLKEECAEVLRGSLSLQSVCDILSLADRHQDEELKSVAHDFILENYHEVLNSENWEKLITSDSLLVAKTLTYFNKITCVKKRRREGKITKLRKFAKLH